MPDVSSDEASQPLLLCASAEVEERGKAVRFEVMHFRQRQGAFVFRVDGEVVAYLNQCAHVPVELDWQPGEFFDRERELLVCAVHGATYEPRTGRCAGGPCGYGRLVSVLVSERDGQVYWYPSRDIQPLV